MTSKAWRFVSWPVFLLGLSAPWLLDCGGGMPSAGGLPGGGGLPSTPALPGDLGNAIGKCPDTSSVDAIEKAELEKDYKLDVEASAKLKAGMGAAVEIREFSAKVDSDLKGACGTLAKDFGGSGDYKTGEEACRAAIKAMNDVKLKMGASARIAIDVKPPVCQASMSVMADCAAKCDVHVKPGEAKVECEPGKLSGECDAKCEGQCDLKGSAKCDGTCSGSCDAQMKGSCGGKCNGKCDGKAVSGAVCTGTCDGKCDADVQGTCSGQCGGSCKLNAAVKCDGTCTGKCSVDFKEPKCTGEIKPPQMSADCKAKCDAQVTAQASCTPAHIGVKVEAAVDVKSAEHYKTVLEKDLPAVLKVAIGLGDRGQKVAGEVTVALQGLEGGLQGMVKGDAATGAKLAACVAAPFKAAISGASSLKANINVSVEVKASASASASGGGAAKAG